MKTVRERGRMEENILNLEVEMEKLREYISDIDFCRGKVEKIDAETVMYKTNIKINVLVILTSVFILICAIMKMNQIVMGVGGALAVATVVCCFWGKVSSRYSIFLILNIGAIAAGIVCFMFLPEDKMLFRFLPVAVLVLLQVFAFVSNIGLKKRIGMIERELDENR